MVEIFRECFRHLSEVQRHRIVMPSDVVLRLNRGERPEPIPLTIQAVVANRLVSALPVIQQYPSYQEFYDTLAAHIGFPTEHICIGLGIEDFIRTLYLLCCNPGEKVATLWPSCAMFDVYARAFGLNHIRLIPQPGIPLPMSTIIGSIPSDTRLVMLPNPSQPVETHYDNTDLRALADYCRDIGAVLAVDEAHWGFGGHTAFPLVPDYDNVVVLRTFSKFYGAASIRLGYAVAQEKIAQTLHGIRMSGEVPAITMNIGRTLLESTREFESSAKEIVEARDWLVRALRRRNIAAYGRYGFSVLAELKSAEAAINTADHLEAYGVLVKAGFPEPVDKCLLIACGSSGIVRRFLSYFEQVLQNGYPT